MDYKEAAKELWNMGETKIGKHTYRHQVKAYEEDNEEYGIDGGHISKLFVFDGETTVASFDRGEWDVEPKGTAKTLADILVKRYN